MPLVALMLFEIRRIGHPNDAQFLLTIMRRRHTGVVFGIGDYRRIGTFELAKDVVEGGAILILGEVFVGSNLSTIHQLEMSDKEVYNIRLRERCIESVLRCSEMLEVIVEGLAMFLITSVSRIDRGKY